MASTSHETLAERETAILAQGLTRNFGHFVAVDHIDIHVQTGEVFGLLGANGAGKTTAIRMLCGMLTPTAGNIRIGSIDMVRHARRARSRIGYVAQRFALYDDLTVEENLKLQSGLYGLTGKRKGDRLAWAFDHLNMNPLRKTLAGDIPLGYKRRMALAAALLHEPKVLFLDEPTSGVDPLARQQFWELIYDLADSGIGILVTTHYMDEALFCDRLAFMHTGRIVSEGTPASLMEKPLATPILELDAPQCHHCTEELYQWPIIREIVPHAGQLMIRLQAHTNVAEAIEKIRMLAKQRGVEITRLEPVMPQLEDVFVSVLEQADSKKAS